MGAMTATTNPAAELASYRPPESFHPLEVIPFFRRWKWSPLRDILYTLIWNSALGVIFWALGGIFRPDSMNLGSLGTSVLVANSVGYTLHAMFMVTTRLGIDRWVRIQGPLFTTAYYTVVSTLGVVVGFTIVALALDSDALRWILKP